ncbi:MAG: hypothetical protein ACPHN2_00185 [Sinimarinibacterium flocculans]|uniref:hypothetical protein n=1 Tax=Sinimarinibacterium flocculans TaxID=985250 RepID=UPI003C4033A4
MNTWTDALRRGLIGGSIASAASAVALMIGGRACGCGPYAPINAPSQWVWGQRALAARGPSLQHTLTGCLIHHGSSVLWGIVHARWFAPAGHTPSTPGAIAGATATAGLACIVDYKLTPPRLRPGFEHHLSRPALTAVYAALAIGLAASTLALQRPARRGCPDEGGTEGIAPSPGPATPRSDCTTTDGSCGAGSAGISATQIEA